MDKQLIADASKKLRLRNIRLYESHLKRFEAFPDSGEFEFAQQPKLSVKAEKNGKLHTFRVFVDLGVRVVARVEQTEAIPLFQIEAIFQIDYEITGTVKKAALDEFARFNGVHNVWPFWRQYVFSMANQAGLPCPEIPLNTSLQSLEKLSKSLDSDNIEI